MRPWNTPISSFAGKGRRPSRPSSTRGKAAASFSDVPNLSLQGRRPGRPQPDAAAWKRTWTRFRIPDFSLLKHDPGRRKITPPIPVQTSRGCPFDCSFCSVTGMFGKKYRFRSTENIIEELRRYDRRGTSIFFYDDNFAANPDRTKELLKAMIRERFQLPVDDPGPGRRHPRPRARPAHEEGRLPHGVHRVRIGQSRRASTI